MLKYTVIKNLTTKLNFLRGNLNRLKRFSVLRSRERSPYERASAGGGGGVGGGGGRAVAEREIETNGSSLCSCCRRSKSKYKFLNS